MDINYLNNLDEALNYDWLEDFIHISKLYIRDM